MSDSSRVFRCDYCGALTPLDHSTDYWREVETLGGGRTIYRTGTYCSKYCGRQDAEIGVGS